MLTVLFFAVPLVSALRVNVTRLQCGNKYDILKEKEIYLDYENFTMELFETCVIKITNDANDKMICIKNEGPYIDVDCAMHLQYQVDKEKKYFDTSRFCASFMNNARCDQTSEASVSYRNHHNHDAKVNVKLYTKDYVEPTTRKPWSSWSSWSSSYDDNSYDDDDDESNSTGTIIGIVVGLLVTVILTFCCVCAKATKTTSRDPQYAPTVQYAAQNGNQNMQQSQNYANETAGAQQYPPNQAGFQHPQRFTSDPPDYADCHVHPAVFQQVPGQSNQTSLTTGQQSTGRPEEPAPCYEEPPPPYPGY